MAGVAEREPYVSETLAELRLLTEVMHLINNMQPDGSIPEDVLRDVGINIYTAVQEVAMPGAVTTTVQRVETTRDEQGRTQRSIKWLGKTALDVAASGYEYHFSEAAFKRVDVEVAEAVFSEAELRPGQTQVFLSPKMTVFDAPSEIAKAEHLHDDDAVRVSKAITDTSGDIIARRLESLLITDVPLAAWVAMLRDPNNLFGRSLDIAEDQSAISVMELFSDLTLSDNELPQGPVTIVKAVMPYVPYDSRDKVHAQIKRFERDQERYHTQAEKTTQEWLDFDIELARSLKQGRATRAVESFIASLQHEWDDAALAIINSHDVHGSYIMTLQLAATLEYAQRNILAGQAAIKTDNEKILAQLDDHTAQVLRTALHHLDEMRQANAAPEVIAYQEAQLRRLTAQQNFMISGGCFGNADGRFRSPNDDANNVNASESLEGTSESSSTWKWTRGICRVKKCPSPQPTEVGPCSVCRGCQHKFDQGKDPTKGADVGASRGTQEQEKKEVWQDFILNSLKTNRNNESTKKPTIEHNEIRNEPVLAGSYVDR